MYEVKHTENTSSHLIEGDYIVTNELGQVICSLHYVGYGNQVTAKARAHFIAGCMAAHDQFVQGYTAAAIEFDND